MRKTSLRSRSSFSGMSVGSGSVSGSIASRKASSASAFTTFHYPSAEENIATLIDGGRLEGKIKIHSIIKNPDYCTSVNYRVDGRFYAVSLLNGGVNVYSSKTNNILYSLNSEDKDQPYAGVSATCVRFRPFQLQQEPEPSHLPSFKEDRRKSFGSGSTGSDPEHFLPPIVTRSPSLSVQSQQYVQRRRKSSVTALGLRSSEVLGLPAERTSDSSTAQNLVTASFTNGTVKTFNFLTEQCVKTVHEDREILTMAYSKSGSTLATGGGDGKIHLYDDETTTIKSSYEPSLEYDPTLLRTYGIAFHPYSEFEFVSGGWNKKILFYDTRVSNLLVASVDGPKLTGEGISFHPSGAEFCVAARDRKRCLELFNYGERKSMGNILENINISKKATPQRNETEISLFLYAVRYINEDWIAFCGSYPGAMTIINNRNPTQKKMNLHQLATITDLENSVNCIDSFRKKIMFIVQNEVACAEVFE